MAATFNTPIAGVILAVAGVVTLVVHWPGRASRDSEIPSKVQGSTTLPS